MKAISAIILLFFAIILVLALYDAPSKVAPPKEPVVEVAPPPPKPEPKKPMSVKERKKHFVETTLPAILRVKAELDKKYEHVLALSQKETLSDSERSSIEQLKQQYKVEGIPCLLNRLRTHPVSIVLAQAALETGWGTSRFYTEANNIFGIWSYNKNEPRIAASETRGAKTIYVKKYASLDASIEGYFKMMATGRAYKAFREARKNEANPFKLIAHLTHYSELREEYVKRLYSVIKSNRFYQYDVPTFKPIALDQIIPEYVRQQEEKKKAALLHAREAKADTLNTLPETAETERREADPMTPSDCNGSTPAQVTISDTNSSQG
jgi:Bax protein